VLDNLLTLFWWVASYNQVVSIFEPRPYRSRWYGVYHSSEYAVRQPPTSSSGSGSSSSASPSLAVPGMNLLLLLFSSALWLGRLCTRWFEVLILTRFCCTYFPLSCFLLLFRMIDNNNIILWPQLEKLRPISIRFQPDDSASHGHDHRCT
jgi:hypothetical protein